MTDSRYKAYKDQFGDESWELDALEPSVIIDFISKAVHRYTDEEARVYMLDRQTEERELLEITNTRWEDVVDFLGE